MKRLVVIIVLLIGCSVFSQHKDRSKFLSMDGELAPFVEQFIQDAEKRCVLTRTEIMEKVDYVLFNSFLGLAPKDYRIGTVTEDWRTILISPKVKGNYALTRLVVYHEFGHIFTKSADHSCGYCYKIMSSTAPQYMTPYYDEVFWEAQVDEFFEFLKKY